MRETIRSICSHSCNLVKILITRSPAETEAVGRRLAGFLEKGDVVGFFGELGSGKTTMIKGIGGGLEVGEVVKSPSFVIVTHYRGRLPVYHIDLYRLGRPTAVMEQELLEYFYSDGICLIEWADRALGILPDRAIRITLKVLGSTERKIDIDAKRPINV